MHAVTIQGQPYSETRAFPDPNLRPLLFVAAGRLAPALPV